MMVRLQGEAVQRRWRPHYAPLLAVRIRALSPSLIRQRRRRQARRPAQQQLLRRLTRMRRP